MLPVQRGAAAQGAEAEYCDDGGLLRRGIMKNGSGRSLVISLIMSAYLAQHGAAIAQDVAKKKKPAESRRSVASLQAGAARGDPEAMYWLGMLHIEGNIDDADYDLGIRMLKRAATKGHKDAQRMYAFMDNAFSGEGC